MKRLLLTAASAAAALTLSLSGCSSDDKATGAAPALPASSDDPGKVSDSDLSDQVVKYVECLQKQGFQVKLNTNRKGWSLPENYSQEQKEAAEAACRSVAPPGVFDKPNSQQLDHLVKIAQCLRDKGFKVKDPTEDHPGLQIEGKVPQNMKQIEDDCEKQVDPGSGSSG